MAKVKAFDLFGQRVDLYEPMWASVLDYGADPTGHNNSSTAFINAMTNHKFVYVPKGNYLLSGKITWANYKCVIYKNPDASITGTYSEGINDLTTKNLGIVSRSGTTFDRDLTTMYVGRYADYTGGDTVSCAIMGYTKVSNADCTNKEWAILGKLDNHSNGGENCGGYFQGNKYANGATFGSVSEAVQQVLVDNPTSGLVGLEVDVTADGLDETFNRVGIDVYCRQNTGAGSNQPQAGYGIRINGQTALIHHGVYLRGQYGVGIDLSEGTYGNCAIQVGAGNTVKFGTSNLCIKSDESTGIGIGFYNGNSVVVGCSSNVLTLRNPLNYNSRIDINKRYIDLYANSTKVGRFQQTGLLISGSHQVEYTAELNSASLTAQGTYIKVVIDGTDYYVPIYR